MGLWDTPTEGVSTIKNNLLMHTVRRYKPPKASDGTHAVRCPKDGRRRLSDVDEHAVFGGASERFSLYEHTRTTAHK